MVDPSPILPFVLIPQAHNVPVVLIARPPAPIGAIAAQLVSLPTCVGAVTSGVVVPFPSLPLLASPHDQSVPSVFRAKEKSSPAATAIQSVPLPICAGEVRLGVVVPLPSRPFAALPHDQSVPSVLIASPCDPPADTASQLVSVPT